MFFLDIKREIARNIKGFLWIKNLRFVSFDTDWRLLKNKQFLVKIHKIGFSDVSGFNCYLGRNEARVIIRKLHNTEMLISGSLTAAALVPNVWRKDYRICFDNAWIS